jgi:sugar O-acyltransferase (sialic acid O-acetyltransferase NeuD family)
MKKYFVEKYNASDDSFKITDIYANSGTYIENGKIFLSIESSKADIDIEVNESGYLYFNFSKGDIVNVGELFYILSNEKINDVTHLFTYQNDNKIEGYTISKKASELLKYHNILPESLNKSIIKEKDVIEFINKNAKKNNLDINLIKNVDKKRKSIIILGAGGGAKMCIDALDDSSEYQVIGLLDDNKNIGDLIQNIPIIGNFNCIKQLLENNYDNFILAYGVLENRIKRFEFYTYLKGLGCKFPNLIHPKSIVEKSVSMGEGNVILAGANIGSSVKMGNMNYINNNSLISHDCKLENNIHIAPGAVLASSIFIKSHVLIGMNSTIFYGLTIGESSTVLNGLIINSSIQSNIIQKISN